MSNDQPDMTNRADYWAQRMADGSDAVSDEERAEFHTWLFDNETNEQDYRRSVGLIQLAADFSPAQQTALIAPSGSNASESDRVAGRRNILKFAALAASAATVLVTGGLVLEHRGFFGKTYTTKTGEQYIVTFADGSVAHLNTRTQIRWRDTDKQRRVELLAGEALFDVVHDEERPFTVALDGSEVRVLGTRFNVRRKNAEEVVVTVLEGTVEVRGFGESGDDPEWVRRISANEQMGYRPIGLVGEPRTTDAVATAKWRDGIYQPPPGGAPLSDVVDELNRYTDKRILILDSRLADKNVIGAVNTRDVSNTLRGMQKSMPVRVRESEASYMLDYLPDSTERN